MNPHHDAQGKFAPASEAGSGGGEHGFGQAPDGKSYTDLDVDAAGEPRFSAAYRDRYGSVVSESPIGASNSHSVVVTDKGSLHVADDTAGTRNRKVLQEMTPGQARSLSDDVYAVNSGQPGRINTSTKARIEPNDRTSLDGSAGLDVTWSSGVRSRFDGDEAFELQEGLSLEADAHSRMFGSRNEQSSYYAEVRTQRQQARSRQRLEALSR